MTTAHLHRTRSTPEGTFGVLYLDTRPVCVTCELPWKNNRKDESCIPAGRYRCVPHNGPRFSNTWEVTGVPKRDAIVLHAANTIKELRGCVAPGMEFGELNGLPAVLRSQAAMIKLRSLLPKEFWLSVIDGVPE